MLRILEERSQAALGGSGAAGAAGGFSGRVFLHGLRMARRGWASHYPAVPFSLTKTLPPLTGWRTTPEPPAAPGLAPPPGCARLPGGNAPPAFRRAGWRRRVAGRKNSPG